MKMEKIKNLRINDRFESTAGLYNEIANIAEKLVSESYSQAEKKFAFPIDIELVAKHLGIDVTKESLNLDKTSNLSKNLAIIMSVKSQDIRIVVDDSVSYKTRRYAIANGVGRYLLNESKSMMKTTYAIPLIPQSLEEIAADSIAVFLLMPITLFKEEFLLYLNTRKKEVLDVDNWMEHLSDTCQIAPFNLAIGYQQMKQVLCYQRQTEFAEHDFDITQMPKDKYEKLFA